MKIKKIIQKIFNAVVEIEKDKLLHYIFGLLLVEVMCVVIKVSHHLSYGGIIIIAIISIAIVYLKELYDEVHKGYSYEIKDIIYGIAGTLTGMLLIMLCI